MLNRSAVAVPLIAGLCVVGLLAPQQAASTPSTPAAHPAPTALSVHRLQTDDRSNPLGIDDSSPVLSWELAASTPNQVQSAYEVQAASSPRVLARGRADLWESGKVTSGTSAGVAYGGSALTSREKVYWRVRVWDGRDRASRWSSAAHWEMGLLGPSDWTAQWVGNHQWDEAMKWHPVTVTLPAQSARYVRLDVTRLAGSYLQLPEIAVVDSASPATDLALGAKVTASEAITSQPGVWEPQFVTDGIRSSTGVPRGYSSLSHAPGDLGGKHIWLQLDLSRAQHFDEVLIYPRTDYFASDGATTRFPVDFTVQTSDSASGPFTIVKTVEGQQPPPPMSPTGLPLPIFAKQFAVGKKVTSARLYATGLGIYDASVNGRAVSKAVLEPPNTDYHQRVVYSTYDVSSLLRRGANTIGIRLGNGTYNTPTTPERYTHYFGTGPPKVLAQLEITYADGSTQTVASDGTWRTTLGATTFSTWFGGESFDARRVQAGWDRPGADLGSWSHAEITTSPGPDSVLRARSAPPIEPVDTVHPVKITEPKDGVYVFDFGVDFAGWEELHVHGPTGTKITMRPSELLKPDGTISQTVHQTGTPIWDSYTLDGTGEQSWHPKFVYHGFRYLQVEGLPYRPTAGTVTGIALRAANSDAGSFESSDTMLNDIHRIIDQAIANNMYSVMTDCPDREKAGWLEEDQLIFPIVARNYDVGAYFRALVQNMAEAQAPDGLVRDSAPAKNSAVDPNWGDAIILTPWQMYQTYGDVGTLRTYYPNMQRYVAAIGKIADGYLLPDYGRGDWGATDTSTPVGVTSTFAYHRMATALSAIASVLGKDKDAARYAQLADDIGAAFNAAYFHPGTDTYASGNQASDALALDMGTVPTAHRQGVLTHLLTSIRNAGTLFSVGEIALPSLLRVLSNSGHDQVIYDVAVQAASPGYGYALVNGATALPSYLDSRRLKANSQSHWMMGAIELWFTRRLGGIETAPGAVGYDKLVIDPTVLGSLSHVNSSYDTPYGTVRSDWRRTGRVFHLDVTIPVNSTATVRVPLFGNRATRAPHGATLLRVEGGKAVYAVGSGHWRFVTHTRQRASHYTGRLTLAAPDQPIATTSQLSSAVPVTVYNLSNRNVAVHPTASATDGFSARLTPATLVVPAHGSADLQLTVRRTEDTSTSGTLNLQVEDRHEHLPLIGTADLARLATMSASSTHSGWSPAATNDGKIDAQHDYDIWNSGEGWNDNTSGQFPDTLTATWQHPVTLSRVTMYTLDAASHPATRYGVRDYDVQARVDGVWRTVAQVRGNTQATVTSTFAPVRADALRLLITDSNDHRWSRVVELQTYG